MILFLLCRLTLLIIVRHHLIMNDLNDSDDTDDHHLVTNEGDEDIERGVID